jgi:hypothetical protein
MTLLSSNPTTCALAFRLGLSERVAAIMMSEPSGSLRWDIAELARAMKVSPADVREYFTDGRRISFILERRIAREFLKGRLAPSEGASFDLLDSSGGKWEVRCITKQGVYFSPSYMVGSGRSFASEGFLEKLAEIEGYLLCDIEAFPDVPFWVVPADQVREWLEAGELGTTTKISRRKAIRLLEEMS